MLETNKQQFIKFMTDIIDSGVWASLSPAAKTLYPVLLKFSDQYFKDVWPSTSLLLKLTGFRSKKTLISAKRELASAGLLYFKSGTGRTNSKYIFSFNYEGSKITPQRSNSSTPSSEQSDTPEVGDRLIQRGKPVNPNQINITITNNNNQKESILKKENKVGNSLAPWESFLTWCKKNLTFSSYEFFSRLEVNIDGNVIYIPARLNEFQKQILLKYNQSYLNGQYEFIMDEEFINISV
jgi:hypothetical protein